MSDVENTVVRVHVNPNGDGETYRVYLTGEERKAARSVPLSEVAGEISAMGVIHSHKVRWFRALLSLLPKDKAWSAEACTLHGWSNARVSDAAVSRALLESMNASGAEAA